MTLHLEETPADHPHARKLLRKYFAELESRIGEFDEARSTSASAEEMSAPNGVFLVGYEGESPLACGGLKRLDATTVEIKRMYVIPTAHRRGHGRRLLEALERAARRLGCKRVVLDTAMPLTEASRLYESFGYRRIPPYNDNPYAAFWFTKDL